MAIERIKRVQSNLIQAYIRNIRRKIECPACHGIMRYNRRGRLWKCECCEYQLMASDFDNDYVFWFCDNCDTYLNIQEGFSTESGMWKCKKCGFENDVSEKAIYDVCKDCGTKLPKDVKGNLCYSCKRKRTERWIKVAKITAGAVLAVAAVAAIVLLANSEDGEGQSYLPSGRSPDDDNTDDNTSKRDEEKNGLRCSRCGELIDKETEADYFDSETLLNYDNIRGHLCADCAIEALEAKESGVYFETCEKCGKVFDLADAESEYDSHFSVFSGVSLRDNWEEYILCSDCALMEDELRDEDGLD